jgi:pimeloyl-ACP methyl ester carboxylesterase
MRRRQPAGGLRKGSAVRILLGFAIGGALLAAVARAAASACARDMRRRREGLAAASMLVPSRHGPVEVAVWGEGPPVVVLHGAGGGHDHGRLLAGRFAGAGFRWIAVSRFGYLRSPLPADASTRAQAEAIADALDALGVPRAGLLAVSGGVPPALQFAARYPDRTTALVLIGAAPFTPLTAAAQDLPVPAWAYRALFATDLPVWALARLAPDRLAAVFDVTPPLRATMTPEDAADVAALIAAFLPVTDRLAGLANEAAAIDPAARHDLAAIVAPALVIHAEDDGINPVAIARYLAARLPRARLLTVPRGGHLLLGQAPELRTDVRAALGGGG